MDPSTNKLVAGDTVAQAKQAFLNMKNILEAANSGYGNGNSLWLLMLPVTAHGSWCVLWRKQSVDSLHVDCQERLKEIVWNECMMGRFFSSVRQCVFPSTYPCHSAFDDVLLAVTIKRYSTYVCPMTAMLVLFTTGNDGCVWHDACTIFHKNPLFDSDAIGWALVPLVGISLYTVSLSVIFCTGRRTGCFFVQIWLTHNIYSYNKAN